MRRDDEARARLKGLLEGTDWAPWAQTRVNAPQAGADPAAPETTNASQVQAFISWARLVSNQRPLACEASALPLSYAPGNPES